MFKRLNHIKILYQHFNHHQHLLLSEEDFPLTVENKAGTCTSSNSKVLNSQSIVKELTDKNPSLLDVSIC